MMKQFIFMGALLLASALTGETMAQCSVGGGWTRVTTLIDTLKNKTACDANAKYDTCTKHPHPGCTPTVMGIQEEHHFVSGTGGELWDFKCGPLGYTSPPAVTACAINPDKDRRQMVGTWSATTGRGPQVTYTYNGGYISGPLNVYVNGGTYDFCNASSGLSVGQITLAATGAGTSRVCPPLN